MSTLVDDLLAETRRRTQEAAPQSAAELRGCGHSLASFSSAMEGEVRRLKAFLFARMYRHPQVMIPINRAKEVVAELFAAFSADPALLPPDWAQTCGAAGDAATGGVVRDYIAGMTDSFALAEYSRVFHRECTLSVP